VGFAVVEVELAVVPVVLSVVPVVDGLVELVLAEVSVEETVCGGIEGASLFLVIMLQINNDKTNIGYNPKTTIQLFSWLPGKSSEMYGRGYPDHISTTNKTKKYPVNIAT